MTIDSKILNEKPREESGPKTSRKYQFQKDLSLFVLLKEHSLREDYLFLFDFHEDLIISNSSSKLKDLECFQIKSKDKGNWTIYQLTKHSDGKSSILGKLYYNRIIFEDAIKSLCFISNGRFKFKILNNGSKTENLTEIIAKNLNSDDLKTCDKCIENEHPITKSEFRDLGAFKVTSLSNTDSATHCVGALAALITKINPNNRINPQLAYEQVLREISRKTNETVGDKSFKHISEVFQVKGISKSQFVDILQKAGLYKSVEDEWSEIKSSLESCNLDYIELLNYKSAWREMSARIIADSSSIPLRDLKYKIEDVINSEKTKLAGMNLYNVVNHTYQIVDDDSYGEYFTKCLIIYMFNES